ncbi:GroES-like protein [Didymella exigua CBS 183.55]|uniref:GroES-like protein n=1 Tax=Didymella exigua CBS 183.55 TaxID=1150837 RepID=A0A6A5RTU3_9PLEO|nr:GroES-like protein [Didymella exigua CBS 183.55]KAF1931272.1 GroES-like protein [Didymella exigua CBS 183.55]
MPTFTVYKGSKEGKIVKSETTKGDLQNDQVLVRVTASGLCGTDEHFKSADMVLGHEGAGVVEETGPNVNDLKKGDRVGWGYQHDCCGNCDYCLSGRETYCSKRQMYGYADRDQGSFASHAVWREAFLFKIPEGLSDSDAAPLMCGGATVFNALHTYGIKPTDRVGVMGVGGLGHLAIQFAARMGCDVVVFSGTEGKKEEAIKLGAKEFIAMKGKDKIDISRKVDALLVTSSVSPDWKLMLPIMAPTGKIFPLTVDSGDFKIPHMGLVGNGLTVQGLVVAARSVHRHMLEFAALHDIKPIVMEFPMTEDGITDAMSVLRDGKMRYRGVLKPQ